MCLLSSNTVGVDYATNISVDAIGSLSSWQGTLVTVVGVMVIITILVGLVVNEWFLKKMLKVKKFLLFTFGYFFYGLFGTGIIATCYGLIKITKGHASSGNPYIFKWLGIIIGIYILMTGFGWVVKKFVDKIRNNWKKAKRRK